MVDAYLIIICLMLIGGVVLRVWQRRLPPVQLHKVSPKAAAQLVGEFIESSYDGQFGYPSGLFRVEQASETQIIAREVVGRGSHFTKILKSFFDAVLSVGSGCGCASMFVSLFLAVMLAPALIYAALIEVVLKYLLRSQIVTSLEGAGDGTRVSFTLRGPVALLVGRRLERAFHVPALPARVGALAELQPAMSHSPGTDPRHGPSAGAAA
jgi:hypothetical protein